VLLPEQLSDSIVKMNYDVKVMIIFHPSKYFQIESFPIFLIFQKTRYIGISLTIFHVAKTIFQSKSTKLFFYICFG